MYLAKKSGAKMPEIRSDFAAILDLVPNNTSVLDIGCGDGELLELLEHRKHAKVRGMEISQSGVNASVARGLAVIQGDADLDLGLFVDDSFDLVILSNTIQATKSPKDVLLQMRRIGKRAIVTLPNFCHWEMRAYILLKGRMPVTKELSATWYETQNVHFCSIDDFAEFVGQCGFRTEAIIPVYDGTYGKSHKKSGFWLNLLAPKAVFVLERA